MASDYTVVQAPGLAERVLDNIPIDRSRIVVLTNSVDTDFWRPREVSSERPGGARPYTLMFVGGIDYPRGIYVAIEVLKLLVDRGSDPLLKVIGEWGPFSKRGVLLRIQRYDLTERVEFLPRLSRETLREKYRKADLLLYQSLHEGSPRVVLEALASGLPVIAAHHPGIDVIDPPGDFVSFTEFGDVDRIVRFVSELEGHKEMQEDKARRGRDSVVARFNTGVVAEQYVSLYNSLARAAA